MDWEPTHVLYYREGKRTRHTLVMERETRREDDWQVWMYFKESEWLNEQHAQWFYVAGDGEISNSRGPTNGAYLRDIDL